MQLPQTSALNSLRTAVDLSDGLDIASHRGLIESIGQQQPHSIHFHSEAPQDNCVSYALGLMAEPKYRGIAARYDTLFAGAAYVRFLLDGRLTLMEVPAAGQIVLYFEQEKWTHMGILVEEARVRSKWGLFPVYDHGLAEVPVRYGDHVRFARPVTQSEALAWFLEWTQSRGLLPSQIDLAMHGAGFSMGA
jgi:hypothetical protein